MPLPPLPVAACPPLPVVVLLLPQVLRLLLVAAVVYPHSQVWDPAELLQCLLLLAVAALPPALLAVVLLLVLRVAAAIKAVTLEDSKDLPKLPHNHLEVVVVLLWGV